MPTFCQRSHCVLHVGNAGCSPAIKSIRRTFIEKGKWVLGRNYDWFIGIRWSFLFYVKVVKKYRDKITKRFPANDKYLQNFFRSSARKMHDVMILIIHLAEKFARNNFFFLFFFTKCFDHLKARHCKMQLFDVLLSGGRKGNIANIAISMWMPFAIFLGIIRVINSWTGTWQVCENCERVEIITAHHACSREHVIIAGLAL